MSKQEFAKAILYLGTTYGKEITKAQMQIWYEYFMNVDYKMLITAIKKIAIKNKFLPTVAELLEECKNVDIEFRVSIINKMQEQGYFKKCVTGEQEYIEEMSDYNKALGIVTAFDNIPSWLEEDMLVYGYKKVPLLFKKERLALESYEG